MQEIFQIGRYDEPSSAPALSPRSDALGPEAGKAEEPLPPEPDAMDPLGVSGAFITAPPGPAGLPAPGGLAVTLSE
jgi:hypothetical protein